MIQIISASYCTDEKGNPYVPRGFGAHAFRYIVVSEFLKNNPEHYHHAAELLNNTVGTTEKIYTYLTPADAFSKYIPQFDNMYEINKQKYLDRAKWSFLQTS